MKKYVALFLSMIVLLSATQAFAGGVSLPDLSAAPSAESGETLLPLNPVFQENIMLEEGAAAFYIELFQPQPMYQGNAILLKYDASCYGDAELIVKTNEGLEIMPDSLVLHHYEVKNPDGGQNNVYAQIMLTNNTLEYRVDLSQTHDYDESRGSLYFRSVGKDAGISIELTEGGKSLFKKDVKFILTDGRGDARLKPFVETDTVSRFKQGTLVFGVGLGISPDGSSDDLKACVDELAKQDWGFSVNIKSEGSLVLEQSGDIALSKDSIENEYNMNYWFQKTLHVQNDRNQSGTLLVTMPETPGGFSAYADRKIMPRRVCFYRPWDYTLENYLLTGDATPAPTPTVQPTVTPPEENTPVAGQPVETPPAGTQPISPVVPIGGGVVAGSFFIFLFIYRKAVCTVKLYGTGKDAEPPETDKLIKEMHIRVKSKTTANIDLTGLFDYTRYRCIKAEWNKKSFRNKTDVTITYLFDGKAIHTDFFKNGRDAILTRVIEMVEKNSEVS